MTATGTPPAVPRHASTVVLLRDRDAGGVEVYMQRRHGRSSFAAHAHVFPGGVLDEADSSDDVLRLAPHFRPEDAAARMGLDGGAGAARLCAGLHVAAVRETFEETGILLGLGDGGGALTGADASRLTAARAELLDGDGFAAVLARHRLRITPEALVYIAHFITPEGEPRRFDTRFFLTRAPLDQEAAVHPAEATHGGWYDPAAVVGRHGGDLTMLLPPTRIVCAELAQQPNVEEAARDLGSRAVPSILFTLQDVLEGRIPERLPNAATGPA